MKQLVYSVKSAQASVEDLPAPRPQRGAVLVRTAASLVSTGTERMVTEFAGMNLVEKARTRPDLVRQVIDKARREGVLTAAQAVLSRLDQHLALGYSSAGMVMELSEGISDLHVGDRVACAGAGFAVHAELVSVPRLLVARIPARRDGKEVSFEDAAFTTLGAVALHGVRLTDAKLGETVAVIGLGLVGQLTVQILKAAGCNVLGMDPDESRCRLAGRMGSDAVATSAAGMADLVATWTRNAGADAVIITAATPSNEPVELAGRLARDCGCVVVVGAVGMEIPRREYYEKELALRVSRSYGPGRYDPNYEDKGLDYPIGYVRWTEQRNLEAFLALLAEDKVSVEPLVSHRFPIAEAGRAYDLISSATGEPSLGVVITYPETPICSHHLDLRPASATQGGKVRVGLVGAGNFAVHTLLRVMKRVAGTEFVGVCAATGLSARRAALKFGFRYASTDENEVITDPSVTVAVIATRHHLHAQQVIAALRAGKSVFCEKPLCLNEDDLAAIVRAYRSAPVPVPVLMVGFNRRFAPMAVELRRFLAESAPPRSLHYRVNAGPLHPGHWLRDPDQGGGRILGEVCHFVDFLSFLAGAPPLRVEAKRTSEDASQEANVHATLEFAGGSTGSLIYTVSGDPAFSKERCEVFGGGAVAVLDDFRTLAMVRRGRRRTRRAWLSQDKGHRAEWQAFVDAVTGRTPPPILFEHIIASTLATLRLEESLRRGRPVEVDTAAFLAQAAHPAANGDGSST